MCQQMCRKMHNCAKRARAPSLYGTPMTMSRVLRQDLVSTPATEGGCNLIEKEELLKADTIIESSQLLIEIGIGRLVEKA